MSDKVDILQFMVIRPANLPAAASLRRAYIRDDDFEQTGFTDADLFSVDSPSGIGRLVYTAVFCDAAVAPRRDGEGSLTSTGSILLAVLDRLASYEAPCPNPAAGDGRVIESLQDRSYLIAGSRILLIPDRLVDVTAPLIGALPEVLAAARTAAEAEAPDPFDKKALVESVRRALGVKALGPTVFEGGWRSGEFASTKRALFDALYLLYILRRRLSVRLEGIIDGLRAMHLAEALAIDEALERLQQQGQAQPADRPLLERLTAAFPSLKGWTFGPLPADLPLIRHAADVDAHLAAAPIIHPLFARLHHFRRPFNAITPLGIGDLKVVKHWLTRYKAGEIAHIDNVLLGETKTRVHRHLEKTEDVFSFSSEQQEETQRDVQTTDRFEMKRETDNILKSDLNVNANANFSLSYENSGYKVLTGVSGGFAYNRSQYDQTKTTANFAREVVDKAVKRVQSRTSQQRSTTKLFETEETNTHVLENKSTNTTNISGIYRWVDKEYSAQVFNYGKRMMFEFVLPEPAAFLVESRLRAYEAQLDFPRPPTRPPEVQLPAWLQQMAASDITEQRYRALAERYDLTAVPYLPATKVIDLLDAGTGKGEFAETGISGGGSYTARTYTCKLASIGYRVTRVNMRGRAAFLGQSAVVFGNVVAAPDDPPDLRGDRPPLPGDAPGAGEINRMEVSLAGDGVMRLVDNRRLNFLFTTGQDPTVFTVNGRRLLTDDVTLTLGFWDVGGFSLSFRAELQLTPERLADWQAAVRAVVLAVEQAKVDEANKELTQGYNAQLATYRNRLAELRATAVNEVLQGQSEAANRQVVLRELKRHCLTVLTKEFDSVADDDVLTDLETMGVRQVASRSRRFRVEEHPDAASPAQVTGQFDEVTTTVDFPVVDLDAARIKGRYIQFLEQAFEWQQLSYLLYPYFWATPPKWIDLMNRSDQTDPFLSAFMQAGSVRILLAVTPAYDEAVLHYLATGEPWEGGPAPVIGDPLYIPLYEELRRQQDDLLNATAEGKPWTFTLPTSLVYLDNSNTPLPTIA
jgi:hypothetical protein